MLFCSDIFMTKDISTPDSHYHNVCRHNHIPTTVIHFFYCIITFTVIFKISIKYNKYYFPLYNNANSPKNTLYCHENKLV